MPSPPPEDDDDFELELEPVDPEILEKERQRAHRKTDDAVTKATFDEIEQLRPLPDDYNIDFSKLRGFRFTTRHLFILTAVLAIGLTLWQLANCMVLFILAMAGIGTAWFLTYRKERQEAIEKEQRRDAFLSSRPPSPAGSEGASPAPARLPSEFRFAFSLKQMLITITAAAVFMAVIRAFGPKALTITLGVIALVGLAVQTFGLFDPPPGVVLAWWLLLVLYLALGLLTAIFPDLMTASRTIDAMTGAAMTGLC